MMWLQTADKGEKKNKWMDSGTEQVLSGWGTYPFDIVGNCERAAS